MKGIIALHEHAICSGNSACKLNDLSLFQQCDTSQKISDGWN